MQRFTNQCSREVGGTGSWWYASDLVLASVNGCHLWSSQSRRWEGASRERGQMYTYGWFALSYGRNQHNIVKQLSSKKKKKKELLTMNVTKDWAGRGGKMIMRFIFKYISWIPVLWFLTINMCYFLSKNTFLKDMILALWDPFQTSDLQSCKINVHVSRHYLHYLL